MAYGKLSREQYHRLVSNRIVSIYAMLPDNEIRTDILKIMEDSIDAYYPSDSQKPDTSDEALPIADVVLSEERAELPNRCSRCKEECEDSICPYCEMELRG